MNTRLMVAKQRVDQLARLLGEATGVDSVDPDDYSASPRGLSPHVL